MSASPHVIDVTDASFQRDVLERSHDVPVVVDFWAPWCGPCRFLGPVLEELAVEAEGGFVLAKIDTDRNPQIASTFAIRSIPAVKAFVGGQVVDEFVGALPKENIKAWLQRLAPSASDKRLETAWQALRAGRIASARGVFEELLSEDAWNPRARLGKALIAIADGDLETAREIVDAFDPVVQSELGADYHAAWFALRAVDAPSSEVLEARIAANRKDVDAHFQLALRLAGDGRWDDALGHLLEVVRYDRSYREDGGRTTMVRIFELLGADDPSTRHWQRELGNVLWA